MTFMLRDILKHCWKVAPQPLRLLALNALCLLQAQKRSTAQPKAGPLYVCGPWYSTSGIGQGTRLYMRHCREQGQDVIPVDITDAMRLRCDFQPEESPLRISEAQNIHGGGTVVIHANPPQFQIALCALGRDFVRHKHIVAYWAWELETFPPIWQQALSYVDSVEVPSIFVQQALQKLTGKPVTVLPHTVPHPVRCKTSYASDGIVRCLYIFDAASSFERKNPLAALRAFEEAFEPGQGVLTFKVNNAHSDSRQYQEFQKSCAAVPGVHIITDSLDADALTELYLRHDIYLSLHRSEGYGLTIREAMLHGLHVVATGWSGNMDFMQGERAHAVPYALVPVQLNVGPCKGLKTQWAEADIAAAASVLRGLRKRFLQGTGHASIDQPFDNFTHIYNV
ncbi:MAG: glycosyltransferase family 4 protein [Desulfovibrio sp.]|nr:glycosyltransferase family 4 protein [Desulfovibrio sp.]